MRPLLSIQNLDVHFGDRPILSNISFDILPQQAFVLMGPGGAGKSTIVRTICSLNAAQQNATFSGQLLYRDAPISPDNAPVLVVQKARLLLGTVLENLREQSPRRSQRSPLELRQELTQYLQNLHLDELAKNLDTEVLDLSNVQRKTIMIVGTLLDNPDILCLDEPTADLNDAEADQLLQFIRTISQNRAIIMVTHNQRHARAIADTICLVAGGRIQECSPIDQFFSNPQSQAARDYIRTGGCSVPSLTAKPEDLEPDYAQLDANFNQQTYTLHSSNLPPIESFEFSDGPSTEIGLITRSSLDETTSETRTTPITPTPYISESRGPRNFRWLRPGQLAGTPQPGLLVDFDQDFHALKRVGVTHLITLTENPLQNAPFQEFDIQNIHFPIVDMQAPTLEDAAKLCTTVADLLSQNATIAYHCLAGIGRTGTMLVAQLIWEGADDQTALKSARSLYPAWVQSQTQEDFLAAFYRSKINNF